VPGIRGSRFQVSILASHHRYQYNDDHSHKEKPLACPFFMPLQQLDGGWLHPSRLPLGNGWDGHCCAPGHEGVQPSDQDLHEFCNMGYAAKCSRLPVERDFDAVRFSVARDQGSRLQVWFVCETGHRPSKHGTLEYDVECQQWVSPHPDSRIQKMLECYVQSYLKRGIQPVTTIGENS
jgi:hypothetical protein